MLLVGWRTACIYKEKGGLDVKSLSVVNKALLCKWSWRFATETNSDWKLVISIKYGAEKDGWYTKAGRGSLLIKKKKAGRGSFEVGLWKDIRKEALLQETPSSFVIGNGKDNWCGLNPLYVTFPFCTYWPPPKGLCSKCMGPY